MRILIKEAENKDARRIISQLLTSDIKQINSYEAVHGAILGDHYHKETTEWFYVIRGSMKYNNKTIVKKGDLFVVEPPERHSLKVLSDKVTFVTFLSRAYKNEDTDIWKD